MQSRVWGQVAAGLALVLAAYYGSALAALWLQPQETAIYTRGGTIATDYMAFWVAGRMALEGQAAAAYSLTLNQVLARELGLSVQASPWFYPPSALVFMAPLAWLPYHLSLLAFLALSGAAFAVVLWRLWPNALGLALVLGFAPVWANLTGGQNGFLSAALVGTFFLLWPQRQGLAGAGLGLLSFKPQLGLVFPLLFVVGRNWQAAGMAALSTALLVALSVWLFGVEAWGQFFNLIGSVPTLAATGTVVASQMTSSYAALVLAGLPPALAMAGQGLVSGLALIAAVWLWRQTTAFELRAVGVVAAMLLATPHLFYYDLCLLLVALVLFIRMAEANGWRAGERLALGLVWLAPAVLQPLQTTTGLALMPVVLLGFMVMVVRRARLPST